MPTVQAEGQLLLFETGLEDELEGTVGVMKGMLGPSNMPKWSTGKGPAPTAPHTGRHRQPRQGVRGS